MKSPSGLLDPHISPLRKAQRSPSSASLCSYRGGSLAELSFRKESENRSSERPPRSREKRKEVRGLSNASRLRFQRELAKINFLEFEGKILFITLTYPTTERPGDPEVWKDHLDKFRKRVERKFGKTPGFWRLELQGKASPTINPHFHLFLFLDVTQLSNRALLDIQNFTATAWYEVCGQLSNDHLLAGTQVKRVNSQKDWLRLSKYTSKKEEIKDSSLITGRVWGVWRKKDLPIQKEKTDISFEDGLKVRRWFKRLRRAKKSIEPLLTEKVFLRHENTVRMLDFLGYQLEKGRRASPIESDSNLMFSTTAST